MQHLRLFVRDRCGALGSNYDGSGGSASSDDGFDYPTYEDMLESRIDAEERRREGSGGPARGPGREDAAARHDTLDSSPEGRHRRFRRYPPPLQGALGMDAWWPPSQDTVVVASSSEDDLTPRGEGGAPDPPLPDTDTPERPEGAAAAGRGGPGPEALSPAVPGEAAVASWAARGAGS
eukprot:4093492-Alexandrium_andersonii.AAC.1